MAVAHALTLPLGEVTKLRQRVVVLAEDRPAVYRMLDASGRVMYVGKAKRLRSRLLSYFRAQYPEDKAARILHAAADIEWDYAPSEFAALLSEMRQIHRHRPVFNVRMNRRRRAAFVKISGGSAPKLYVGRNPAGADVWHYGPFLGVGQLQEAIRVLNDLLGLRDCSLRMPIVYRGQGDLFETATRAGCLRHELGTCSGPCAGFVTEAAYRTRVAEALAFLECRTVAPVNRVVEAMTAASAAQDFERAAWWRDRFDVLTWLLQACTRLHAALEGMTFVYLDTGVHGDDRAYVIRRAQVRAAAPAPRTPIEREAFRALVAEHAGDHAQPGPVPSHAIDETVLVMSWFRRRPAALRHTVPLDEWLTTALPGGVTP
jgi:excinuclease ABC subunit C